MVRDVLNSLVGLNKCILASAPTAISLLLLTQISPTVGTSSGLARLSLSLICSFLLLNLLELLTSLGK